MCLFNLLDLQCFAEDAPIQGAAAKVVEAACTKYEDNKDAFMAVNIGNIFCQSLSAQKSSDEVAQAVSRAVVKLTTADDDRPTVSRSPAFTFHLSFHCQSMSATLPSSMQSFCAMRAAMSERLQVSAQALDWTSN